MGSENWFISIDGEVTGPFNRSTALDHIPTNGRKVFLWSKGQKHWLTIKQWKKFLEKKSDFLNTQTEKIWHFKVSQDAHESHPLNKEELLSYLKVIEDHSETMIWNEHIGTWRSLFKFGELTEELGVLRRHSPRVNVSGNAILSRSGEALTYTATGSTISEGGMGLSNISGVSIGQIFSFHYTDKLITAPIRAKIEIIRTYKKDNKDCCSVRFLQIEQECQAAIIEYIKKSTNNYLGQFKETKPESDETKKVA